MVTSSQDSPQPHATGTAASRARNGPTMNTHSAASATAGRRPSSSGLEPGPGSGGRPSRWMDGTGVVATIRPPLPVAGCRTLLGGSVAGCAPRPSWDTDAASRPPDRASAHQANHTAAGSETTIPKRPITRADHAPGPGREQLPDLLAGVGIQHRVALLDVQLDLLAEQLLWTYSGRPQSKTSPNRRRPRPQGRWRHEGRH